MLISTMDSIHFVHSSLISRDGLQIYGMEDLVETMRRLCVLHSFFLFSILRVVAKVMVFHG